MLDLDAVSTLGFSAAALVLGSWLVTRAAPLRRVNLPPPVVGGLIVAVILTALRTDTPFMRFDTTFQQPLMIAFFASIGFAASVTTLRRGGRPVLVFLVLSSIVAVLQNVLGVAIALGLGEHPLLGVITGSVALTGGPGTTLAFAPEFERAGVAGAGVVGLAAAIAGIVAGGLAGTPLATWLIDKRNLRLPGGALEAAEASTVPEVTGNVLLGHVVALVIAMWLGSYVSAGLKLLGITLPAYVGAMVVAAAIRNIDERREIPWFSEEIFDRIGSVALALFLSMALVTLKLWELGALAGPLLMLLGAQLLLVAATSLVAFRVMGADYEAAVMSSGFAGFMLGTTANALANMDALRRRFGPAPRAFLVVPLVGACFIDATNAGIIVAFLNVFR